MFTGKLNLSALKNGLVKGKTEGETLICIPVKANKLFLSEKTNNVYLNLVAFDIKNPEHGKDTHILKQSFSKDELEKMTKEEKEALPILGNARVGNYQQSETNNSVTGNDIAEGVNDLPF